MRVVGTAGHVDHGKSTLVAALTGIHPDRLKEEQDREMTIDLGFAWMDLPGGDSVGIVDVPGHRDFIENMLAGVSGIDAVIFVVAADEGVMPQTREHLAILDLLQVPLGVIVLTKIDLVNDSEWLDLIEQDVRAVVHGTVLENSPILRVSAKTGAGLQELKEILGKLLDKQPERINLGRPRLPIDRVFTMQGFGTVVTGTLLDGQLQKGDEVEILPNHLRARIRGLQTHRKNENTAVPGSRTAVNLGGVSHEEIRRGDVLVIPGTYPTSQRLDVSFRLLADASAPIRHNQDVKFFLGATETSGRVRLIGSDEIKPGGNGWLQLELTSVVVAVRGDHYILRRPSPGETLGGGRVVDATPEKRHLRYDPQLLARLESFEKGVPGDILVQIISGLGIQPISEAFGQSHLPAERANLEIKGLIEAGRVIQLEKDVHPDPLIVAAMNWEVISQTAEEILWDYHRRSPLKSGMPKEEMKSRLKMNQRVFIASLEAWVKKGWIEQDHENLRHDGWVVQLSDQQTLRIRELLEKFKQSPFATPSVKDCKEFVGEALYQMLVEKQNLIEVSEEVVFEAETCQRLKQEVQSDLLQKGKVSVAEFRDRYQTSRKYALAFLEYLDKTGITIREGDYRRLR
jgi:selenocysteine-specific elongation factor